MRPWDALAEGTLLRRYKRFLADVRLQDGTIVTAHCPNSGSMLGMRAPGSDVLLSHDANPRRKLPWTLEMVRPPGSKHWIGCNTMRPNRLVEALLAAGALPIDASGGLRREVRHGASRIDLVATASDGTETFVEVKNATLAAPCHDAPAETLDGPPGPGAVALFPDAVTQRGAKHMRELAGIVRGGTRAAVVFFVNRGDCSRFCVAAQVDPAYAAALEDAVAAGVEVLAVGMDCGPDGWRLRGLLPVIPWRASATPVAP